MFSEPCQPSAAFTCRPVDPANGGVNHVSGAEISLLDHEAPTITASGPAYEQRGRWLPATPNSVTIAAADPGSGVRSYNLRSTGPGGSRTTINRTVNCELKYTQPALGPQQCPTSPGPSTPTAGGIGALSTGTTTFTAAARDLAGQASRLLRWAIKVDRQSPKILDAPALTRPNGRFVRVDQREDLAVSATDAHSGVREIVARVSSSSGTTDVQTYAGCGANALQCPRIARGRLRLRVDELPSGTATVTLRVTDLVGNVAASRPVRLRVDGSAPNKVALVAQPSRRNPTAVTWLRPADPGGSGIAYYEYRIFTTTPTRFQRLRGDRRINLPKLTALQSVTIEVRAIDRAGNVGQAGALSVTSVPGSRGRRTVSNAIASAASQSASGLRGSCSITVRRATGLRDSLRAQIKGGCKGRNWSRVEVCIYHREFNAAGDLGAKDTKLGCSGAKGPRSGTVTRSLRVRCDPKYNDDPRYEARFLVESPGIAFQNNENDATVRSETPFRQTCPSRAGRNRCQGPLRRAPADRRWVAYIGYVGLPVYVGITNDLRRRCREHQADARGFASDIRALGTLPYQTKAGARGVEQALIEYYGYLNPSKNRNVDTGRLSVIGVLVNDVNSTRPERDVYCSRIRRGRGLMNTFGYARFTPARHPLKNC